MRNNTLHIILTAGGTGGHILPAIAVANAIKKVLGNEVNLLFVGAENKMEMTIVPKSGYEIIGLPIVGLQRRLTVKNLNIPIKWIKSVKEAKRIIANFKADAVIGFGGYASAPILRAAQKMNIPIFIQEQNAFPGMVNRILGKNARKIFVAYPDMEKFFSKEKIEITGNPIRDIFFNIGINKKEGKEIFGLNKENPLIFVMGGSQGARSINIAIKENIDFFIKNKISLIWQTGRWFVEEAQQIIKEYRVENLIKPVVFIDDIHQAYAAADIVISRAGAISIAELCAAQKLSILVPLPIAAEDHQTKNAQQLENAHAGILLKDNEVKSELVNEIKKLLNSTEEREQMSKNMAVFAKQDAAEIIAKKVIRITKDLKDETI